MFQLHLIKFIPVVALLPGLRSPRSATFSTAHSGTFCRPWSLLRKALIRAGKTPYKPGTRGINGLAELSTGKHFTIRIDLHRLFPGQE